MDFTKEIPEQYSKDITEEKLRERVKNNKTGKVTVNGQKFWLSKKHINELKHKLDEEKEGGIIPILPILAGLASLGALSGGVATTVAKATEAKHYSKKGRGIFLNPPKGDQLLLNPPKGGQLLLNPPKGDQLLLNPSQGKGVKDFLKNILIQSDMEEEGKKVMKTALKNLSDGIKVKVKESKHGMGIYLKSV